MFLGMKKYSACHILAYSKSHETVEIEGEKSKAGIQDYTSRVLYVDTFKHTTKFYAM
jgi:hypothetical protein